MKKTILILVVVFGTILNINAQAVVSDPQALVQLMMMVKKLQSVAKTGEETVKSSSEMYELWKTSRDQLKTVTDIVKTARQVTSTTKKVAHVYGKYGSSGIYIDDERLLKDIEPEVFEKFEKQGRRIMDGFTEDLEDLAVLAGKDSKATMSEFERLERMDDILSRVVQREKRVIRLNQMMSYYVKQKRQGEIMGRLSSGTF
jgi:nicotinic acid mononucleotide adenylyltransferase